MTSVGMPVVGFVTDGEFSSIRTMGNSRPISIIQLISDARAEARSTPLRPIESYLTLGRNGRNETTTDVLKSMLAIYLFREKVRKLKEAGCDFSKHLVVPENDSNTGEQIHQREYHNHLLKRIIACLREGVIPGIDLCHFRDALHDPHTGLTYEAVTGKNKQSVPDCERMISPGVITFMESNGHHKDAKLLCITGTKQLMDGD